MAPLCLMAYRAVVQGRPDRNMLEVWTFACACVGVLRMWQHVRPCVIISDCVRECMCVEIISA